MHLTRKHIEDLRGKSPEGVYQLIRQFVREECGAVDRDELAEALRDALAADLLDQGELRKLEDEW